MQYRIRTRTLRNGQVRYYPQAKTVGGWSDWLRFEAMGRHHTKKTTISFVNEAGAQSFIDAHKED